MLKIDIKVTDVTTPFARIARGTYFVYEGTAYVRHTTTHTYTPAVRLTDGVECYFSGDTPVRIINNPAFTGEI